MSLFSFQKWRRPYWDAKGRGLNLRTTHSIVFIKKKSNRFYRRLGRRMI